MIFSSKDMEEINNFLDEQLCKACDDEMIDLIIKDQNYLMGIDDEFNQILDAFRFTVTGEYEYSSTKSKTVGFKDHLEDTKEFLFFDPPQKISDPTFELDAKEEQKRIENEKKAKEEHMKLVNEYIRKSREFREQKENIPKRILSDRLKKCRPPPLKFTSGDSLAKL